uniref:centrosomal protein CCDC61 n=1 Tax=Myxine glutinosa TaxID=7769 RepID=UPI00358DE375
MAEGLRAQSRWMFAGKEFSLRLEIGPPGHLALRAEDLLTGEVWQGEFDSTHIEDLTHKTGNFKQFPVFCSMLESAINKTSDSVSLDLMTYADLEVLHRSKLGASAWYPAFKSSALHSKRYLILIYSVEFDRIYYPLSLVYGGGPDPAALLALVRELHKENAWLRKQCEEVQQDKVLDMENGGDDDNEGVNFGQQGRRARKKNQEEQGALRQLLHDMHEELENEREKSQKAGGKCSQEQRHLMAELAEVKASERQLQARVKSLMNELTILRRGHVSPAQPTLTARRAPVNIMGCSVRLSGRSDLNRRLRSRSSSHERMPAHLSSMDHLPPRSGSREQVRNRSGSRERVVNRSGSRERVVNRSGSMERVLSRSGSRERSLTKRSSERRPSFRAQPYSRTPSPSPNGIHGRFDPTSYVQRKEEKRKQVESKRSRQKNRQLVGLSGGMERARPHNQPGISGTRIRRRSHSGGSTGRQTTPWGSGKENASTGEPEPSQRQGRKEMRNSAGIWQRPTKGRGKASVVNRLSSSRRTNVESQHTREPAAELSEIDERLQALQQYMQSLDVHPH